MFLFIKRVAVIKCILKSDLGARNLLESTTGNTYEPIYARNLVAPGSYFQQILFKNMLLKVNVIIL